MALLIRAARLHLRRMGRLLRWQVFRALFLLAGVPTPGAVALAEQPKLGPFETQSPKQLAIPLGDQTFDADEALNGARGSSELCARVPGGLWVEVDGTGECIRTYAHGLSSGANPLALIYFSGDVMLRTGKGVRYLVSSYKARSPRAIETDMELWSREAGVPAIFVARPGLYGSSGDHNQRRHRREMALMDGALEELKRRHAITSFILAGHSAGGQIAAALMNRRKDLQAVVMSSPLVSVRQVSTFWEDRREIPGRLLYDASKFYDPVDEIDRITVDRSPRIYVISDPEDRSVPFFSQLYYVRRLRSAGLAPEHVYAHAPGPARHLLAEHGKKAAALIARGEPDVAIRRALLEMDLDVMGR